MRTTETREGLRVERSGRAARITLDRPARINALTMPMVRGMTELFEAWRHDDGVAFVVLDSSSPRGFCAGGDIDVLRISVRERDGFAQRFWHDEYLLDDLVARYPKPVVAIMPGIVMGGGLGLGAFAFRRIVTETTRIAMPECRIGLIPDVGATYFLPRMPGETGTYLGLTGASLDAADAIELGLADALVPTESLDDFVRVLMDAESGEGAELAAMVERFARTPGAGDLAEHRPLIDRAFAGDSVEAIVTTLEGDPSPFARECAAQIAGLSPTSLKLMLRSLRLGRDLPSPREALRMEYRVMYRLMAAHDFTEGVRAAIVDKDRNPRWQPASLEAVDDASLAAYFSSLGADDMRFG